MLLGGGLQELACDGRVLDGGGVVDPEHGGEVERAGAVGEGFLELPVDAKPFEGGGEAAACLGQPVLADRPGGHGGLLVDDQVRVGGAGPAAAAVLQPGQEQAFGQVVERAGPARNDQPPVAGVDVVEMKFADGLGPGGVDGGQGDREAGGRCDGGSRGLVYLGGLQRLDEDQGTLAVVDAAGRSRKILPVFLQWPNSERKAVRV